jgi:PelA/Pel-15E family pectate lyase
MRKATTFMTERVALKGGYVWAVSDDLTMRWGEIPARPSQIWVQDGTVDVGNVLLDAYDATGDAFYLHGARRAADALVFGQHPLGGWHYFIDFDPKGLAEWYEAKASRFTYGYEEYRHYYGNCTYDDSVTSGAALYLLRFYRTTMETAYRGPVLKALEFVLQSQYPNGAWPQRYPLRYEFAHHGLPDYTSYYTLNDGVMAGNVNLLIEAYETLGDLRYVEAAQRAADVLISLQGPEGEAAWAEQHGFDMRPVAARTHEPAGYVIRESRDAIRVLQTFYLRTGDRRYLDAVSRCLAWFDRVNREAIAQQYPIPRYWEPGTNKPIYVVGTGEKYPDGYGIQKWTNTPEGRALNNPRATAEKPVVDVAALRKEFDEISALATKPARDAYLAGRSAARAMPRPADAAAVDAAVASLDARGAWVTDNVSVHKPVKEGFMSGDREDVRAIATPTFVRNMSLLIDYVRGGK